MTKRQHPDFSHCCAEWTLQMSVQHAPSPLAMQVYPGKTDAVLLVKLKCMRVQGEVFDLYL